jgi:hypothetical protein
MGFKSFWNKLFSADDDINDEELNAARARHGIKVETPEEQKKREISEREAYDPWEEVRNVRSTFFLGGWVTKKFRIIGEDKVKKELEEIEKKKKAKAEEGKRGEGK